MRHFINNVCLISVISQTTSNHIMSNSTTLSNFNFLQKNVLVLAVILCSSFSGYSQSLSKSENQRWLNNLLTTNGNAESIPDYQIRRVSELENNLQLVKATVFTDCQTGDCKKTGRGLITPKGDTLAPLFKEVIQLSTGNVILKGAEKNLQITPNLKVVKVYDEFYDFEGGLAVFVQDGRYGICNSAGIVLLKPTYDYLGAVDDQNRIPARKGDEWIILERNENKITKRKSDQGESGGKKIIKSIKIQDPKTGLWALLNDNVEQITPYKYRAVIPFAGGITIGQIDYNWGLIDTEGKEISTFEFDGIAQSYKGHFKVSKGRKKSKYGLLNNKGEEVIPVMYNRISKDPIFSSRIDNLYWVVKEDNNKWGILAINGKPLTLMRYQKIDVRDYNNPKGLLDGKWVELLKKEGKG